MRVRGPAPLLIQFLPLSLFTTYAFWEGGAPRPERWQTAFVLGAVAAVLQLAITLPRKSPTNRLILAANLYLLVGGLATVARQWRILELYGILKESGLFASMLLIGAATTLWSPAGYVGAAHADRRAVRVASLWLYALTVLALGMSLVFRGHSTWAAVVPVVALAISNRYLAHRLESRPGSAHAG